MLTQIVVDRYCSAALRANDQEVRKGHETPRSSTQGTTVAEVSLECQPSTHRLAVTARVLLLAVDGAVAPLLTAWADQGLLPTIQRLRSTGFAGAVDGPMGFGDAPTWATVHTGVSPAHHARYSYREFRQGTYQKVLPVDADLMADPFWVALSEAGKRVAVLDMPKSPRPDDLNGVFLGDWLVHGREHSQPVSFPAEFAQEVLDRYGPAPPSMCGLNQPALDAQGYQTMLDRLMQSIEMKRDLILSILDREDWDLLAAGFKECHCIGHHGWNLHDPEHPAFDPEVLEVTGDPLLRIYQAVDEAIGEIIARAGAGATTIAFTPLGMGPHYGAFQMLSEILARLGHSGNVFVRSARRLIKALAGPPKATPGPAGDGPPSETGVRTRVKEAFESRRRCLTVDLSEHISGLRLNLVGREHRGRVDPKDRHEFEDQLIADFSALKDANSGLPLVDRVLRTRDYHSGPMIDRLPDLLVYWNMTRPVSAAASPKFGTLKATGPKRRTGAHRDGGILFAYGPHIGPGTSSTAAIDARRIAPTVAGLLDLDFPQSAVSPVHEITDCEAT